ALGPFAVSGTSSIAAGITINTGTQTYGGLVTLTGTGVVTLTGTSLTLNGTGAFTGSGTQDLTLNFSTTPMTVNGTLYTGLRNLNFATAGTAINLTGGTLTTAGTINFAGPVTLQSDMVITSTAGASITFGSTV